MEQTGNTNLDIIAKGTVGGVASLGGAAVSILPNIEMWMRLASLGLGLCIGVASLVSIILNIRAKLRESKGNSNGNA